MNHRRSIPPLSLLLTSCLLMTCGRQTPGEHTPSLSRNIRVTIGPVLRDTVALPLFLPGKLATETQLKLGFKTGGIIRDIKASEGATVARGARIALLDTVEFAAWHEKARTALEKASRDLNRAQQLFTDSVATLEQLQNARSAFHAAESDLAIASFNLSQAVLTAPSSGKILKRLAEKNEVIGPGMPVVIFASTEGNWIVKAAIPDRDLAMIAIGDKADVSFDALPEQSFYATLTRIAGAAHPVTGTFEIELTLDGSSRVFRPGLVADVKLYPAAQRKTAFVPAGALVEGHGDSATVYAVDSESRFSPVPVIIGRLFGDLAAITTGLDGIDTVVVTGAPYLRLTAENITIARE